jgi:hypothetical protein
MKRVAVVWCVFLVVGVLWCAANALGQGEEPGGEPRPAKRYSLWQFIKGGGIISIPRIASSRRPTKPSAAATPSSGGCSPRG